MICNTHQFWNWNVIHGVDWKMLTCGRGWADIWSPPKNKAKVKRKINISIPNALPLFKEVLSKLCLFSTNSDLASFNISIAWFNWSEWLTSIWKFEQIVIFSDFSRNCRIICNFHRVLDWKVNCSLHQLLCCLVYLHTWLSKLSEVCTHWLNNF